MQSGIYLQMAVAGIEWASTWMHLECVLFNGLKQRQYRRMSARSLLVWLCMQLSGASENKMIVMSVVVSHLWGFFCLIGWLVGFLVVFCMFAKRTCLSHWTPRSSETWGNLSLVDNLHGFCWFGFHLVLSVTLPMLHFSVCSFPSPTTAGCILCSDLNLMQNPRVFKEVFLFTSSCLLPRA